jgi:hypothetical protein
MQIFCVLHEPLFKLYPNLLQVGGKLAKEMFDEVIAKLKRKEEKKRAERAEDEDRKAKKRSSRWVGQGRLPE